MLITKAKIIKKKASNQVEVQCDLQSSCDSCQSKNSCGASALNQLSSSTPYKNDKQVWQIEIPHNIEVEIGEQIEIGISDDGVVNEILKTYGVPLLSLFTGFFLAYFLNLTEGWSGLLAFSLFFVGIWANYQRNTATNIIDNKKTSTQYAVFIGRINP